jgi:hypothetical protein
MAGSTPTPLAKAVYNFNHDASFSDTALRDTSKAIELLLGTARIEEVLSALKDLNRSDLDRANNLKAWFWGNENTREAYIDHMLPYYMEQFNRTQSGKDLNRYAGDLLEFVTQRRNLVGELAKELKLERLYNTGLDGKLFLIDRDAYVVDAIIDANVDRFNRAVTSDLKRYAGEILVLVGHKNSLAAAFLEKGNPRKLSEYRVAQVPGFRAQLENPSQIDLEALTAPAAPKRSVAALLKDAVMRKLRRRKDHG